MSKYIPPEQRTLAELQTELDRSFRRWDDINEHGCTDPFWADGVNMNLVRNHIIYYYRLLADKLENVQLSLFDTGIDMTDLRPIPPEVDPDYMSPTGRYPDRLKGRA
jgi:hypothetical protein